MAIDSRRKRQNVAEVGAPLPVSVLPQGSIDAFARAQIAWTYGGIPISPPASAPLSEEKIRAGVFSGVDIPDVYVGGM